jgi:hypothetical protein
MIRSIYTEPAYYGHYAFLRGDDQDEDSPHGWGMTKADARANLEEQLADIACEYAARIETHCETARSDDWLALVRACNEKELNND